MNGEIMVIRYEGWMNWCHQIGWVAFAFTALNIGLGFNSLSSPYGWMLAVAFFEIVVTTLARSRFRIATLRALQERGVDLTKQRVAFL